MHNRKAPQMSFKSFSTTQNGPANQKPADKTAEAAAKPATETDAVPAKAEPAQKS